MISALETAGVAVLASLITAGVGPAQQWWRDRPRKRLLRELLKDEQYPVRSLDRLKHVTGTSADECRRLLIASKARGVIMDGGSEGWALISRYPLSGSYRVEVPDVPE